jgi:hypothetical protein
MNHPGLEALMGEWDKAEYAAGYRDAWGLLFDAGGDARVNGIPFDDQRTAPWKEGWIETDINLGAHGVEAQ